MRPKIIIVTLGVAAGLLATMIWLSHPAGSTSQPAGAKGSQVTTEVAELASKISPHKMLPVVPSPVNSITRAQLVSPEEQIERMEELARKNDPASLDTFLDALANADIRVRQTALQAILQLDDCTAIPGLQQTADRSQDPTERSNILNAITFLNLPGFGESHDSQQLQGRRNPAGINIPAGTAPQAN